MKKVILLLVLLWSLSALIGSAFNNHSSLISVRMISQVLNEGSWEWDNLTKTAVYKTSQLEVVIDAKTSLVMVNDGVVAEDVILQNGRVLVSKAFVDWVLDRAVK